jgi:GNAT superfamily N-acetyltransferase
MAGYSLTTLHGEEALPFVDAIGRLRIEVFREFPYLYDGDLSYERRYLEGYFSCPQSVVGLVHSGKGEIVGATTGLPLSAAESEWQAPFNSAQISSEEVFYFGESVLRCEWRGLGIGKQFFDLRENFAASLRGVKMTAFCAVRRSQDDPRRPAGYRPLDTFWHSRGYQKATGMSTQFEWLEIGEAKPTQQTLDFWLRRLT